MRRSAALLVVVSLLSLGVAAGCGGDDETGTSPSSTTSTISTTSIAPPQRSVLDAITTWLTDNRATVFPGFEGEFVGACEPGVVEVLCAIPREDLGVRSIVGVGAAASDWGTDLLLQHGDEGWTVVDSWNWDLESAALGPPFSPLTAIAEWWATIDPNAVFVRSCDEIQAPTMGEALVCAVLESGGDEVRQYRTGPAPTVDAHHIEVRHEADHSWVVED